MFSELVIAYLFLGGTGGGACVVVGALGLLADGADVRRGLATRFRDERGAKYGRFFSALLIATVAVLALAVLCLLVDMGRLDRVLLLAVSPLENYLVVGAWALAGSLVLCVTQLALWRGLLGLSPVWLRAGAAALVFAGGVTVLYTGLLLSSMQAVPLWDSAWLPFLFALSGLSSGLALVVLVGLFSGGGMAFGSVLGMLTRVDAGVVVAEALCLGLWLVSVWTAAGSGEALEALTTSTEFAATCSVLMLVSGQAAPWFWGGLVCIGLLVPFSLEGVVLGWRVPTKQVGSLLRSGSLALKAIMGLASVSVLAGAVLLRCLVVSCGLPPSATYAALVL